MITTTLERIRKHRPCEDGWTKLLGGLGKTKADDEMLPFAKIVEINGLQDALWCCQAEPQYDREWRLFAVWCVRQVQHLIMDPRSITAIDVTERYAHGQATEEELATARAAQAAHRTTIAFGLLVVNKFSEWYAACAAWHAATADADVAAWHAADAAACLHPAPWAAQTKEFLRIVNKTEARACPSS